MRTALIVAAIVIGGALTGFAVSQFTNGTDGELSGAAAVLDCPAGDQLTSYSAGSRVYAVARTSDSAWVQVRDLSAPDQVVWVHASSVELDESIDQLPEAECPAFDDDVQAIDASTTTTLGVSTTTTVVGSTTTTINGSTTTTAEDQTTTTSSGGQTTTTSQTTTTTAPDTEAPEIKQPSVSELEIWEENSNILSCPAGTPRESEIGAIVTDNVSLASVTASWNIGGNNQQVNMSPAGDGFYSGTFGPFEYLTIPDNTTQNVTITIEAVDTSGNSAKANVAVTVNSLAKCFG